MYPCSQFFLINIFYIPKKKKKVYIFYRIFNIIYILIIVNKSISFLRMYFFLKAASFTPNTHITQRTHPQEESRKLVKVHIHINMHLSVSLPISDMNTDTIWSSTDFWQLNSWMFFILCVCLQ